MVCIQYDNSGWSSSEEILRSIFWFDQWIMLINDSTAPLLPVNPTIDKQEKLSPDYMDKYWLEFLKHNRYTIYSIIIPICGNYIL